MVKLNASDVRIPTDAFNRVVYLGETVTIERRDGARVHLISDRDFSRIQSAGSGDADPRCEAALEPNRSKFANVLGRLAE